MFGIGLTFITTVLLAYIVWFLSLQITVFILFLAFWFTSLIGICKNS